LIADADKIWMEIPSMKKTEDYLKNKDAWKSKMDEREKRVSKWREEELELQKESERLESRLVWGFINGRVINSLYHNIFIG
jgi:predicted  nucleic acid-binding Zn-ribbon protein